MTASYSTSVPKLVSRQFDDEIVLANYDNGLYYSLLGAGADVWLAVNAGVPPAEIINEFIKRHPSAAESIAATIPAFIDSLVAEGILWKVKEAPTRRQWAPMNTTGFAPPEFERFDDLQDLLLLDPVHEVSEAGWPIRPDDAPPT